MVALVFVDRSQLTRAMSRKLELCDDSCAAMQVIRVLHMNALGRTMNDLRRMRIVSRINQFHAQLVKLGAYVFMFVHWNACLQYGSCTAQGESR